MFLKTCIGGKSVRSIQSSPASELAAFTSRAALTIACVLVALSMMRNKRACLRCACCNWPAILAARISPTEEYISKPRNASCIAPYMLIMHATEAMAARVPVTIHIQWNRLYSLLNDQSMRVQASMMSRRPLKTIVPPSSRSWMEKRDLEFSGMVAWLGGGRAKLLVCALVSAVGLMLGW